MKQRIFLAFLLLGFLPAGAQTYWQQHVATTLKVTLDDQQHMLYGQETFVYTNHSPDTLKFLYIHLWPNAYSSDRTVFSEGLVRAGRSDFYYSKAADKGYIDSLDFHVDGTSVNYTTLAEDKPDIARIDLPTPLPPGGNITVSTPFRVKVPIVFSRMGHTGQAYYISQWFPKPAVYDHKGWHPLSYSDQGEFYSEIGSYDATITLPKNYVVMATGNCMDERENRWLDSLSKVPFPPDTLYAHWFPPSSPEMKTLHFTEDNIHDFAWFADKRWIVRKDTAQVLGRATPITVYAAFLPANLSSYRSGWQTGTDYIKATVKYLSAHVGVYSYATAKAVSGDMRAGGGMEYPTVTVIDRKMTGNDLRSTIVHEVGHNWFYGILATNERDDAWMDEGINTFYEQQITRQLALDTNTVASYQRRGSAEELGYYQHAATHEDQAIANTSFDFTATNYGLDVYYKTAMMLRWLQFYMGRARFEAAMKDYFEHWQHRHPYPEDMKAVFARHAAADRPTDWFFDGALYTDRRVDFGIESVKRTADGADVTVTNNSSFAAPVAIRLLPIGPDTMYRSQGLQDSITWTAPFIGSTTIHAVDTDEWTVAEITPVIPDGRRTNNFYRTTGLIHEGGLQLQLIGTNRGQRNKIYLSPAIGYNKYDGFELGLLLHNISFPETQFRYILAPQMGLGSKRPVGTGTMAYYWFPNSFAKEICLRLDGKTYDYDATNVNIDHTLYARYIKVAPSLTFTFRHSMVSTVTNRLMLKGYFIREQGFDFNPSPADTTIFIPSVVAQNKGYGLVNFTHKNDRLFNPFSYSLEAQGGAAYMKLSAEGNLRIDYNVKGKSLYVRAYAGKFYTLDNTPFAADRYYLTTTYTGANDYLYDDLFYGRSEQTGTAANQVAIKEGGFTLPTPQYASPIGRNDDWLLALNLKTDLPLKKLPVRFFLNVATMANAATLNPNGSKLLYEGGAEVHLFSDILEVWFPFVMSSDYKDYYRSLFGNKAFTHSISFSLQLQNIDWLKFPDKIISMMQ